MHEVRARGANTQEPFMRHACVILQAVTEIIAQREAAAASSSSSSKKKKKNATTKTVFRATSYFGALMTSLEQVDKHSNESLGALCYLLSVALRKCPDVVVKAKAEPACALLADVLSARAEDAHTAHWIISAAAYMLHIAADVTGALARPSLLRMVQALFVFGVDPRPKVRKAAQRGAAALCHRIHSVGAFPRAVVDAITQFYHREMAQATPKQASVALHVCGLLAPILPLLPTAAIAEVLEPLLRLCEGGNAILTVQVMRVAESVFTVDRRVDIPAATATKHADLVDTV
jgi:ribosomal RNA-processing protein 12